MKKHSLISYIFDSCLDTSMMIKVSHVSTI